MKRSLYFLLIIVFAILDIHAQQTSFLSDSLFQDLPFRNIGPYRGGRSVASAGVPSQPMLYYMGTCGGGIWKTEDAGISWKNISDGYINTGSIGAIAVADADPNVIYAGTGEHAIRGVMTSGGDGMYKSMDGGDTWTHIGLENSRHIAEIRIHPDNADHVYVAVQGAAHGANTDRGIYESTDGGQSWNRIFYINDQTGVSDLSMDIHNPRILYAGTWDHIRHPWQVRSGGAGSGLHKSTDGGKSWKKLSQGLPKNMGKTAIDVSPANPKVVYANIEAQGEKAGVYRSNDGGKSWKQTTKDRVTVARAWYYIEIFADPVDENRVYVLNAPMLKSIDGGKSFKSIKNPHGDQHHMWINPANPDNILLSNDGGACITFNGGQTWSSQTNQPTAQFYRVITDNRFPYYVYGGQQDNSAIAIASRTNSGGIGWKDWYSVAGGESAFLAFDPDDPELIFGGTYQGIINVYDHKTRTRKDIMAYPTAGLGWHPKDMKYRWNWNSPIVASPQDPTVIYHGGNKVLRTVDNGLSWTEISPDLTRNDTTKHVLGGAPYTNEGAGGEVYNTLSYLECSEHEANVIWAGSDCGLVHMTRDGGGNWTNVTPRGLPECLINAIDVSPHEAGTAYIAAARYKFNDYSPMAYRTTDYGKTWTSIIQGIDKNAFVRVVREDLKVKGLLYAGTERGLYYSTNNGSSWKPLKTPFPAAPISDIALRNNALVLATLGRSFWILDDLSPIQQSIGMDSNTDLTLLQPEPVHRIFAGGRGGGPNAGKNPSNGLNITYYLPDSIDNDTTELSLTITDTAGHTIRTYSNKRDKTFKKYIGGPSAPKQLTVKKGLNYMTWDLKRSPIQGVEKVFLLGGYDGSMVPPGEYTLTLSNGKTSSQSQCKVLADPRLDATPKDYTAQDNMLAQLEGTVKEVHNKVIEMRSITKRLKSLIEPLGDSHPDIKKEGEGIIKRLGIWERNLIQPDQKTFQDVINFPNKLNAEIVNLMNRISSHNPILTEGAKMRRDDIITEWTTYKKELQDIIDNDITTFNTNYEAANIPAVIMKNKRMKP